MARTMVVWALALGLGLGLALGLGDVIAAAGRANGLEPAEPRAIDPARALAEPTSQAMEYVPGSLGSIRQPAPQPQRLGAEYAVGPYPLYTPQLAAGAGRDLVLAYCGMCHSTTYITTQPRMPPAFWEGSVQKMIKTFGAPVPPEVARRITAYLQRHYAARATR